ncbi:PIN domain-containing protein [Sphingomonas sp.]|uniref:PIN domain-containing protein n=1 Tax=Sphingomonas sp. TaxID=28214 RepID=UPI003B008387
MTAVIDAAAAMALMLGERGAEMVAGVIKGSSMTAINVSECCSRGVERGASVEAVLSILRRYEVQVVAFDLEMALEAARLRESSRSAGAGIGDRACLALARRRSLPLYTADKRLSDIADAVGVDVRQIR